MEHKNIPEIRFSGFTNEWEERKLKDVVEKQIKGKAQFEKLAPGNVEYLDTARLNGGKSILTNGLKDVMLDDILILWDGSKAGTVYHGFEGALGSTLKAYRTSANSKFIYQYLKRHKDNIYKNYRTPNIPHVQKDFLDVFPISVPKRDEQEKIGSFFQQLDNNITLHQRKLDLLKEQKKGFLQKMFPKNSETVPELRFSGFTNEWEQRKLGDLSKVIDPHPSHRAPAATEVGIPFIGIGDVDEVGNINYKTARIVDEKIFEEHHNRYNLAITSIGIGRVASLGKVIRLRDDIGKYAVSPTMSVIQFTNNNDLDFLYSNMNTPIFQKQFKSFSNGSTRQSVGIQDLRTLMVSLPIDIEEQKKIGLLFKQLDDTIALHQRKLELLKEQKKGFLQKMFPKNS